MKKLIKIKKDIQNSNTKERLTKGTILPVFEDHSKNKARRYLVKNGILYWYVSDWQADIVPE